MTGSPDDGGPMTLTRSRTDPRTRMSSAVMTAGAVLRGVRPDQLGDPTPCTDDDVRTLVGHLVEVLHRVAAAGRGDDPFLIVAPDPASVPDDGWADLWTISAHAVQSAWSDDATLGRTIVLPWVTAAGGDILLGWASEIIVHTWDLAEATGQAVDWDEELLAAVEPVALGMLPGEGRAESFAAVRAKLPPELARHCTPPYADVVPVPADAPAIDRIVAWHGRRP